MYLMGVFSECWNSVYSWCGTFSLPHLYHWLWHCNFQEK